MKQTHCCKEEYPAAPPSIVRAARQEAPPSRETCARSRLRPGPTDVARSARPPCKEIMEPWQLPSAN
eukprot:2590150-Pleurochrysis_carterae.AAC.2